MSTGPLTLPVVEDGASSCVSTNIRSVTTSDVRFSKCRYCRRRDTEVGGDGTCPIRSSFATWNTHVAVHVNGCRAYRAGDNAHRRPPEPTLPPLQMFK